MSPPLKTCDPLSMFKFTSSSYFIDKSMWANRRISAASRVESFVLRPGLRPVLRPVLRPGSAGMLESSGSTVVGPAWKSRSVTILGQCAHFCPFAIYFNNLYYFVILFCYFVILFLFNKTYNKLTTLNSQVKCPSVVFSVYQLCFAPLVHSLPIFNSTALRWAVMGSNKKWS